MGWRHFFLGTQKPCLEIPLPLTFTNKYSESFLFNSCGLQKLIYSLIRFFTYGEKGTILCFEPLPVIVTKSISKFISFILMLINSEILTPEPYISSTITLFLKSAGLSILIDSNIFSTSLIVRTVGIVFPIFRDKAIYEWYVCGKDKAYKNIYPSFIDSRGHPTNVKKSHVKTVICA